ncbi:unnamed protein product, partial [Nesidiocoris tenuis]
MENDLKVPKNFKATVPGYNQESSPSFHTTPTKGRKGLNPQTVSTIRWHCCSKRKGQDERPTEGSATSAIPTCRSSIRKSAASVQARTKTTSP